MLSSAFLFCCFLLRPNVKQHHNFSCTFTYEDVSLFLRFYLKFCLSVCLFVSRLWEVVWWQQLCDFIHKVIWYYLQTFLGQKMVEGATSLVPSLPHLTMLVSQSVLYIFLGLIFFIWTFLIRNKWRWDRHEHTKIVRNISQWKSGKLDIQLEFFPGFPDKWPGILIGQNLRAF